MKVFLTFFAAFLFYENFSIYLFRISLSSRLTFHNYIQLTVPTLLLSFCSIIFPFHISRTFIFTLLIIFLSRLLQFEKSAPFFYHLSESCIIFILYLPIYVILSLVATVVQILGNFPDLAFSILLVFFPATLGSYFLATKYSKSKKLHSLVKKHSNQKIILLSAGIALFLIIISATITSQKQTRDVLLLIIAILLYVFYSRMVYCQTSELSAENDSLTRLLHDNSRRSLERAAEIDAASPKAEVSALAELNAVNHSYDPAVEENPSDYIDSTGMPLIDEMLQNYYLYACRRGIDLRVYVHDPLTLLFSDYTPYWKQISDTIGNLVANAITAVEKSHAERPEVFCAFGVVAGKHYEIHIFDSGLDFPAKVLERLGEEGNTTGGSGIGMMSILEASRVAKFSLRIQEGEPCYPYTKKIFVVFDGEGRIEIETWRAAQLHVHNPRITVKQLGGELHV